MLDLKEKWVLITGASRGIGRLSALFMADQGCNLILHSRTKEGTKRVLEEVLAKGVNAFSVSAELSNMAEVDAMLKQTETDIMSI